MKPVQRSCDYYFFLFHLTLYRCWVEREEPVYLEKDEEKYLYQKTVIQFDAFQLHNSLNRDKPIHKVKNMNEGRYYYGKSNEHRNIFTFEENKKNLNLKIMGFNELVTLNLEQEGTFPWAFGETDKGNNVLIDVSFSYEKGAKLVTIRSNVTITNRLTRPLSIRFNEKEKGNQNSLVIQLNIGESSPVPLTYCDFSSLEIKPLGPVYSNPNTEFKWSKSKSVSKKDEESKVVLNTH